MVHLGCLAACAVQLAALAEEFLHPTQTVVNSHRTNLSEMARFPAIFKVCVRPAYNQAAVEAAGYGNVAYYFIGRSRWNRSHVGWAGHSRAGGKVSDFGDIQGRIMLANQEVLKTVRVWTRTGNWTALPGRMLRMRRLNYPDNCITVDISSETDLVRQGVLQLFFRFHLRPQFRVELRVEDRETSVDRADKFAKLAYTGPTITMDSLTTSKRREYMVEVQTKVFVEQDPAQACRTYPNAEFESFNDCDMAFMRCGIASSYRNYPAFVPLMVAANGSEATAWMEVGADFYTAKQHNYRDMTDGTARSDCPTPCTSHRVLASFLGETLRNKNYSEIVLTLSETVSVTTTSYPEFRLGVALAEVGGAMGLWLGLGVLQILDTLTRGLAGRGGG